MELAKTYVKVACVGGACFVCKPSEVADMTAEEADFKIDEVQMTEAEFEALPEFQG